MLHPLKSSQTTKQQSQNQTVWLLPQFKVRMIILKWLTDKRIFLLSMDSNGFENPKTEHYTHCLQQTIIHAYKKNQSFYLKSLVGKKLNCCKNWIFHWRGSCWPSSSEIKYLPCTVVLQILSSKNPMSFLQNSIELKPRQNRGSSQFIETT